MGRSRDSTSHCQSPMRYSTQPTTANRYRSMRSGIQPHACRRQHRGRHTRKITPHIKGGVSTAQLDRCAKTSCARPAGSPPPSTTTATSTPAASRSITWSRTDSVGYQILKGGYRQHRVTPKFDGWIGDTSRTFQVGAVSILAPRLVKTTYEAMWPASTSRPRRHVGRRWRRI